MTYELRQSGDAFEIVWKASGKVLAKVDAHPWYAKDIVRLMGLGEEWEHELELRSYYAASATEDDE